MQLHQLHAQQLFQLVWDPLFLAFLRSRTRPTYVLADVNVCVDHSTLSFFILSEWGVNSCAPFFWGGGGGGGGATCNLAGPIMGCRNGAHKGGDALCLWGNLVLLEATEIQYIC